MNYVAGFLLSPKLDRVVLVLKNRPSWQAGLLNAVGGKVEEGENAVEAMRREFREEAGIDVENWVHDSVLEGDNFQVDFFSAQGDVDSVRSLTDEPIITISVADALLLGHSAMRNIRLLLSIALDRSGVIRPVLLKDGVQQP